MAESKSTPKPSGEARLSSQSTFSTVKENTDLPENTPAPGKHVIEELGVPSKSVKP